MHFQGLGFIPEDLRRKSDAQSKHSEAPGIEGRMSDPVHGVRGLLRGFEIVNQIIFEFQ